MDFQQLLDGVEVLARAGESNITGVEYDSRRVRAGDLFVAIRGESSDGNRFVQAALRQGAAAIVSDAPDFAVRNGVPWARVHHGRPALARISSNFYGRPAEKLAIIGITGTNGKSTTAFLLESILNAAGRKTALLGTIEYHIAGRTLPALHTTPESLELNRLFSQALLDGATETVMEVSSHALAQERVFGIPFGVVVFTNLTRDHLDYHHTFEEYFTAKKKLFTGCGAEPPQSAVINLDDQHAVKLVELSRTKRSQVLGYGLTQGEFCARDLEITPRATRFCMVTPNGTVEIFSPLLGRVNVYNMLAAAAAAFARECDGPAIARGIRALQHVPGRFELVDCGQPFAVVVDYAHTDDALQNLTAIAREFVSRQERKGRVITLFGCGGDRDRTKRPLMGEAAGQGSDFVVLTSDNPRSEEPMAIINDALPGIQRTGTRYTVESDRKKAILLAIGEAKRGDIVLLAGKGHEKVQVGRAGAVPFDDVEVARAVLGLLGYSCQGDAVITTSGSHS